MHEYHTPFGELREWTASQITLFLKRMAERYERQTKARRKPREERELTENDLDRLGLMKG